MADWNRVVSKRQDVSLELLEHISEQIAAGAPANRINELTLAYRYLEGGAQPGSVVVQK